jgi:hypothetical protein
MSDAKSQPQKEPARKTSAPTARQPFSWWYLLNFVFWTIFIWLIYPVVMIYLIKDPAERGQFGDTFGALNTLFSGLAFVAVIYTMYLQGLQLDLQRRDLLMNREELHKSVDANRMAAESLKEQIHTQLLAAQITACGMLLESYNEQIQEREELEEESRPLRTRDLHELRTDRQKLQDKLHKLLASIELTNGDSA